MPNTNVMHIDTLLVALILVWYPFFGEFLESLDSEKYEFTTSYFIFGYRWLLLYYQTQSTTTSTCNTS